MLIDIIAAGLPGYIAEKINREEVLETEDLFNDLGKLEHLTSKKITGKSEKINVKSDERKPCSICKEKKNKNFYHS